MNVVLIFILLFWVGRLCWLIHAIKLTWFDDWQFSLIYFYLTYFNPLLVFLILFLPSCVDSFFPCFRSFLLVEMGMGIDRVLCWVCEIVGLFFSFFSSFFSVRALFSGFIAYSSSCVWLCCSSTGGLVDITISLMQAPHSMRKFISPLQK